jgi:hypothetical protein
MQEVTLATGALEQASWLIGSWEWENVQSGAAVMRGTSTFEWLEHRAFILHRSTAHSPLHTTPQLWLDNSPYPTFAIIGHDDPTDTFSYVYADQRSVRRIYEMSVGPGSWKFWGTAGPDFHQRFAAQLSADGRSMHARIERSSDYETWELDFETTYTRP